MEALRSRKLRRSKRSGGDLPLREHAQPGSCRQGAEERRLRQHRRPEGSPEQPCWVAARCGSAAERSVARHSYPRVQEAAVGEEAVLSWQTPSAAFHRWACEEEAVPVAQANRYGAAEVVLSGLAMSEEYEQEA